MRDFVDWFGNMLIALKLYRNVQQNEKKHAHLVVCLVNKKKQRVGNQQKLTNHQHFIVLIPENLMSFLTVFTVMMHLNVSTSSVVLLIRYLYCF